MQEAERRPFGRMPDGTPVELLWLCCGAHSCAVLTYGAAIQSLNVPARDGRSVDVALGFDTLEDYRRQTAYVGATVGRVANRIGGACFSLNGQTCILAANDGKNSHHGGRIGFDKQVWTVERLTRDTAELSLFSPDGQEGYPGGLSVRVTYILTPRGLEIGFSAESSRDTVCNLTNHAYFNLSGHSAGPVEGHEIQIFADAYTPTDDASVPTGQIAPVAGTPLDLRARCRIGDRIDAAHPQLQLAGGFDQNWVIDGTPGTLRPAARAFSPDTGITLEMQTTAPGLQFYTGNDLDGTPAGKGGAPYAARWGFCLEGQSFPDAPNHPNFPSVLLRAGVRYERKICYLFAC